MADNSSESRQDHNIAQIDAVDQDNQAGIVHIETRQDHIPTAWTPVFMLIFALILALGLSMTSVITQGWLNRYYTAERALLVYTSIIFLLWLANAIRSRHTPWLCIGNIFGCCWCLFSSISYILTIFLVNPNNASVIYVNAAADCALLAAFICISTVQRPLQRWDHWIFRLMPIAGLLVIALSYLLTDPASRSSDALVDLIAAVALYFSIAIWWLRPSRWQYQAGLTFFFGMTPALLLIIAIPHLFDGEANFLFLQITQLCLILGVYACSGTKCRKKM